MKNYVVIDNTEIDQDSSVTQPLMEALRDNPEAIAGGAPGAPRVLGRALMSDPNMLTDDYFITVAAADTYEFADGAGFSVSNTAGSSTTSTSFITVCSMVMYGYSGSVRFKATQNCSSTGRRSYLQLVLNGAVVNEWNAYGVTAVLRSQDVTISPGDVVEWRLRAENDAVSVQFSYQGVFADDALYRLAGVAKRSDG